MRLDSAGNMGLGVTPSAWNANGKAIENPGGALYNYTTDQQLLIQNAFFDGAWKYKTTAQASYYQQAGGKHAWYNAASGTAGNTISFTQAMTLDASGNWLVGTTGQLINNARISAQGVYTGDSNTTTYSTQRATATFSQDGGGSSNNQGSYSSLVLSVNTGLSGNPGALMRGYGGNGGNTYNIQINENGNITNTNNSYGSLSDESLKENIVDATPKLNDLMAVQVRSYNLKADEKKTKQLGVVAQELEAVFPAMVETEADGLKSVKYSVFVPMLIKAIQEQQAIIQTLTDRITALEQA
jgi:hypothetical protein